MFSEWFFLSLMVDFDEKHRLKSVFLDLKNQLSRWSFCVLYRLPEHVPVLTTTAMGLGQILTPAIRLQNSSMLHHLVLLSKLWEHTHDPHFKLKARGQRYYLLFHLISSRGSTLTKVGKTSKLTFNHSFKFNRDPSLTITRDTHAYAYTFLYSAHILICSMHFIRGYISE